MTAQNTDMTDILDFSRPRLEAWLAEHAMDAYRAGQIMVWLYKHQAEEFAAMTSLSKAARELLAANFAIPRLARLAVEVSADGCRKYLFGLRDGQRIETVLIPEGDYATLCVSSQVGCALDCRFCLTAKGGFVRNLAQGEILAQIRDIRRDLDDPAQLSNLVFMGMGEPLANLENLLGALEIITDSDAGLGFAARRVTVSTAGLAPKMLEFGQRTRASLAVSLNAVDDQTRSRLMPINRRYPLKVLLDACRDYPLPPGRRITFEYVLLGGVNDAPEDARRLCRLLRPIRCKVNLIPFNPHAGCGFEPPSAEAVLAFREELVRQHFTTMVRHSRGQDISAACGQLRAQA